MNLAYILLFRGADGPDPLSDAQTPTHTPVQQSHDRLTDDDHHHSQPKVIPQQPDSRTAWKKVIVPNEQTTPISKTVHEVLLQMTTFIRENAFIQSFNQCILLIHVNHLFNNLFITLYVDGVAIKCVSVKVSTWKSPVEVDDFLMVIFSLIPITNL